MFICCLTFCLQLTTNLYICFDFKSVPCLQKKVKPEVKCYNSHLHEISSNKSYEIMLEIKVRSKLAI